MIKSFVNILNGLVIIGYLSISYTHKEEQKKLIKSNQLIITLLDNETDKFINLQSIQALLEKNNIHKMGDNIYRINKEYIEYILEKNLYIKKAEVFINSNFKMNVEVRQVEPLFRVISGKENYYVDSDKNILSIQGNVHAHVHIAVGKVTNKLAKKELFNLFSKVKNDKFWNSQLDHVYVNEKQEAIFFVKLGVPKVYFGRIENIDEKLQNLFAFYKHTLKSEDLSKYSKIDVRFKDQIICKKTKI